MSEAHSLKTDLSEIIAHKKAAFIADFKLRPEPHIFFAIRPLYEVPEIFTAGDNRRWEKTFEGQLVRRTDTDCFEVQEDGFMLGAVRILAFGKGHSPLADAKSAVSEFFGQAAYIYNEAGYQESFEVYCELADLTGTQLARAKYEWPAMQFDELALSPERLISRRLVRLLANFGA